jgi:hypothetical protein
MSVCYEKIDADIQLAKELTVTSTQKLRNEIAAQVDEYLKSGGIIKTLQPVHQCEVAQRPAAYGYDYEKPIPPGIRYFKKSKVWKTRDKDGNWRGNYKTMGQAQLGQITYSKNAGNIKGCKVAPDKTTTKKTKPHKKIALTRRSKHSPDALIKHINNFHTTA